MDRGSSEGLTFDEDLHEYRVHGRVVPSVTQILKSVYPGMYEGVPEGVLERKARLGTAVHKAIELGLAGRLGRLHPEIEPYVWSWRMLTESGKLSNMSPGEKFYHPAGDYCGEYDCRAIIGVKPCVVEWKTTADEHRSHRIQLAGYAAAIDPSATRVCVYLAKDGGMPAVRVYEDQDDMTDWYATLRVYRIGDRK